MKKAISLLALTLLGFLAAIPESFSQDGAPAGPAVFSAKVVCSLNGFFCAATEPDRQVTIVYRRRAGGVAQALWSMKGTFPVAFISNDGEYLIVGNDGGGVLPSHYKRNQVMISFYDRGRLIHEVRLDDLVRDLSKMPQVDGQYRWGAYLGLNADDYLTVQLFDQSWVLFDVKSGRMVR